jgi:hypothetical protein
MQNQVKGDDRKGLNYNPKSFHRDWKFYLERKSLPLRFSGDRSGEMQDGTPRQYFSEAMERQRTDQDDTSS